MRIDGQKNKRIGLDSLLSQCGRSGRSGSLKHPFDTDNLKQSCSFKSIVHQTRTSIIVLQGKYSREQDVTIPLTGSFTFLMWEYNKNRQVITLWRSSEIYMWTSQGIVWGERSVCHFNFKQGRKLYNYWIFMYILNFYLCVFFFLNLKCAM